jgi:ABC-type ATPase involved in cell division
MIDKLRFKKFTAFEELEISFSKGINVFIGANGTGKTHVLKVIYAACDITQSRKNFAEKITKVFLPSGERIGRLAKRGRTSVEGSIEVFQKLLPPLSSDSVSIRLSLSNHTKSFESAKIDGVEQWLSKKLSSVYIPVKDMMANAPGFRSLYEQRNIHFEEIYADVISRSFLPVLRGPIDKQRKEILTIIQKSIEGKVVIDQEEFFLENKRGKLEFTLLAEGYRKLALLWLLIQNGTLLNGSILCWDEPEANLNPRFMRYVVEILIALERLGVQIFLATHDYVLLKEFDLQATRSSHLLYHSLSRNRETGEVEVNSTEDYLSISPNVISETFGDLVDREIKRSMGV